MSSPGVTFNLTRGKVLAEPMFAILYRESHSATKDVDASLNSGLAQYIYIFHKKGGWGVKWLGCLPPT